MADQEFLASFAVEIDESGVSRLQAFYGRAAECVNEALSAASARGYLTEAGLGIVLEGGNEKPSGRMHSLSDGFAFVGWKITR